MIISWIAIILLALSYWFQIYKIHKHKEVRDLSIPYHILLAIGFGLLTWQAYLDNSVIFMAKQILTTIPVIIIVGQIFYHKKDKWHDDIDPICDNCSEELEIEWKYCPYCGKITNQDN